MKNSKKKQDKNNNIPVEEIFSKYPPAGVPARKYLEQMKGYTTWHGLRDMIDPLSWLTLEGAFRTFKKTKDPLILLNTLMVSHECGYYPPSWVINEIVKRLKRRYDDYEKTSLDKLFGFNAGGKGKNVPFIERSRGHVRALIMKDIYYLTLLGYLVKEAAAIVEKQIRKEGNPKVGTLQIVGVEYTTLKQEYSNKWSKIFNNEHTRNIDIEWLRKNKKKFLAKFHGLKINGVLFENIKPSKKSPV